MTTRFFHLVLRLASAAVVLAVLGWLGYESMARIRDIAVVVQPETLPPDGHSEAVIEVQATNVFGLPAWRKPAVRFQIEEGNVSGQIVQVLPLSARIRATQLVGRIVVHVHIQGYPIPYEIVVPVRPHYAFVLWEQGEH